MKLKSAPDKLFTLCVVISFILLLVALILKKNVNSEHPFLTVTSLLCELTGYSVPVLFYWASVSENTKTRLIRFFGKITVLIIIGGITYIGFKFTDVMFRDERYLSSIISLLLSVSFLSYFMSTLIEE